MTDFITDATSYFFNKREEYKEYKSQIQNEEIAEQHQ